MEDAPAGRETDLSFLVSAAFFTLISFIGEENHVRSRRAPFSARLFVVGGQSQKVGKTALAVDLIRAFPKARWTAVKITPYIEVGCPVVGPDCTCAAGAHTYAIRQEFERSGDSDRLNMVDTKRYLAAGAERAFWVRTKEGQLKDALDPLGAMLQGAENVIIESGAIVRFWKPDLFLMVLDPSAADFKPSARAALRLVDIFVFRSPRDGSKTATRLPLLAKSKPGFLQRLGSPLPQDLVRLVRQRFRHTPHPN